MPPVGTFSGRLLPGWLHATRQLRQAIFGLACQRRAPPDLRDEKNTVAYAINSTRASTFLRSLFRLPLHYASERVVYLSLLYAKGEGPNGDVFGAPDV